MQLTVPVILARLLGGPSADFIVRTRIRVWRA